jgi:glycosyltransferase involved in cell wall biosynthesis
MFSASSVALFLPRPDVVIGTSPQFFAAVAAWLTALVKRRPFVFELRDLWPESILAVGAMQKSWMLAQLERFASWLYRQADLMVPVTRAFARTLEEEGVDDDDILVITNGIEPGSYTPSAQPAEVRARWGIPADAFVSGFIGTLGMAHGVKTVLEAAELLADDPDFHFVVMGNGADRREIEAYARERELKNVTIIEGQPRQIALDVLNSLDASLVLLKNTPLFETVIPSKIFEAMELGKPIVLGVRGESLDIVENRTDTGIGITPEAADELVAAVRELRDDPALVERFAANGKQAVQDEFRRTKLAGRMLAAIEKLADDD